VYWLGLDEGSLRFFKNGVQHGPGYPAGSLVAQDNMNTGPLRIGHDLCIRLHIRQGASVDTQQCSPLELQAPRGPRRARTGDWRPAGRQDPRGAPAGDTIAIRMWSAATACEEERVEACDEPPRLGGLKACRLAESLPKSRTWREEKCQIERRGGGRRGCGGGGREEANRTDPVGA
jgi:hypothetical protein